MNSILRVLLFLAIGLLAIANSNANAYDFSAETIVKTIGEEAGVWPAMNITEQQLADAGIKINKNDGVIPPIYRLSDMGKVLGVTVYIEEWNRSPPLLYMMSGGPLGHSLIKEGLQTQTQIVVYDETSGMLQYVVFDPWGTAAAVIRQTTPP